MVQSVVLLAVHQTCFRVKVLQMKEVWFMTINVENQIVSYVSSSQICNGRGILSYGVDSGGKL